MPKSEFDKELTARLDALRQKHGESVRIDEIQAVVESVLETRGADLSALDIELYREIEALARFIHTAKSDIASLRPDEVKDEYIPVAADELGAIVAATAEATHAIMDAAEVVESVIADVPKEAADKLLQATTRIYEACTFQDITGQRTTKVVKTLQQIEGKVDGLVKAFGSEIEEFKKANPKKKQDQGDPPSDEDLLAGPQRAGEGNTQEDVDALLAKPD